MGAGPVFGVSLLILCLFGLRYYWKKRCRRGGAAPRLRLHEGPEVVVLSDTHVKGKAGGKAKKTRLQEEEGGSSSDAQPQAAEIVVEAAPEHSSAQSAVEAL